MGGVGSSHGGGVVLGAAQWVPVDAAGNPLASSPTCGGGFPVIRDGWSRAGVASSWGGVAPQRMKSAEERIRPLVMNGSELGLGGAIPGPFPVVGTVVSPT